MGRGEDESRYPARQYCTRRNLTGGKLKWCEVADLEGTDDDQSDGQTARQAVDAMERLSGKPWFIAAGFHRPHDPFVVNKRYVAQFPDGALKLHRDPKTLRHYSSIRWLAEPLKKHLVSSMIAIEWIF